ncbi:plastid transcriptionally active 3 [Artemisia annua]|uniref:Plastid transcriptionally active 3 n=1 Tax=Artemisia annua TaxID=35608 RepID=A0A2U1LQI8_ARTAN|nr:plastid transcriptionally active 3 [Artemisia annua]
MAASTSTMDKSEFPELEEKALMSASKKKEHDDYTCPLTDKFMDFNYRLEFAHRMALISDGIYKVVEQTEIQVGDKEAVKDKETAANPLHMTGNDDDEEWLPLDILEGLKELRDRKIFDTSDMYTIADAWGSRLGWKTNHWHCAIILREAIRAPYPSALDVLGTTHILDYVFGSYAIVEDLKTSGITVPDETLDMKIRGGKADTSHRLDGRNLWMPNIGDSRVVLCERGYVTKLPGDVPRVNGQLAVAHAHFETRVL